MDFQGSDNGWCVGDAQSSPDSFIFMNSPFATGRGTDVLVRRSDMTIVLAADHGTPTGNDNLSGQQLLQVVRDNEP